MRILKKVVSRGLPYDSNNNPHQNTLALTLPQNDDGEPDEVFLETIQRNNSQKLIEDKDNDG